MLNMAHNKAMLHLLAGASTATVSRVINRDRVGAGEPVTRERVECHVRLSSLSPECRRYRAGET